MQKDFQKKKFAIINKKEILLFFQKRKLTQN